MYFLRDPETEKLSPKKIVGMALSEVMPDITDYSIDTGNGIQKKN